MNHKNTIGWHFPPTNGGQASGFNDAGIEYFTGSPLSSLARETVQNSMDARRSTTSPVCISFELIKLECASDLRFGQLREHLSACIRLSSGNRKAEATLTQAYEALEAPDESLEFLRISDRETTGLKDENWRALVKMQGASIKHDATAGGSFGFGKYAPFAVSPIRTVCYWTCFSDGTERVEKFQGKCILMSHNFAVDGEEVETQGTGFFGYIDDCTELRGTTIPERFRVLDNDNRPIQGTALWIAGVLSKNFSQSEIARSVIENFFWAIQKGHLKVIIEPDDKLAIDELEIDNKTISKWFDALLTSADATQTGRGHQPLDSLREAKMFLDLLRETEPTETLRDRVLGRYRLWIRVDSHLPSKVALIRNTGMLITTKQRRLLRFPGLRDFVAVCVFDSQEGNELLRQMENPQHNQFEPNRLPESDRRLGRLALRRVVNEIRDKIKEHAAPVVEESDHELTELVDLLPDVEAPSPYGGSQGGANNEKAFGVSATIKHRLPRRRIKAGPLVATAQETKGDGDGDGKEAGNYGGKMNQRVSPGPNPSGGSGGDGAGAGGTGPRGGSRGHERIEVSDVRLIQKGSSSNRCILSFTPMATGLARIRLSEAGDSYAIQREDIAAYDQKGNPITLDSISVDSGKRISLEVEGSGLLAPIAWSIVLTRKVAE